MAHDDDKPSTIAAVTARCVTCGYDLRAIARESKCPECGTPAALSLTGYGLSLANPNWLRRLVIGQTALAFGFTLALICLAMMGGFILLAWTIEQLQPSNRIDVGAAVRAAAIGAAVSLLLALAGVWLVTAPEPQARGFEQALSARRLARVGILLLLLTTIAWPVVLKLWSPAPAGAMVLLSLVSIIAVMLTVLPTLRWLHTLARRAPDDELRRASHHQYRFARWALPTMVACSIVIWIASLQLAPGAGLIVGISIMVLYAVVIVSIAYVLFLPWMLLRFRRLFAGCYEYGRAHHTVK